MNGSKPVESGAWEARIGENTPSRIDDYEAREAIGTHLTSSEKKAVKRREEKRSLERTDTGLGPGASFLRTVGDYPRVLVEDLRVMTGCSAKPDSIAIAEVSYRSDGRVKSIGSRRVPQEPGCPEFVRALIMNFISLDLPEKPQTLLVSFHPEFLGCIDSCGTEPLGEKPDREPRLRHSATFRVQQDGRGRLRSGRVIMGGVIASSGCVSKIWLIQGMGTPFDVESMRALATWRFSPAMKHGKPVSILGVFAMTIQTY